MRNRNGQQNSSCEYAEQVASYLYDEFDENQKSDFETHLQNCHLCADELADFSMLHSSIKQWKTTDFDSLPTPIFVLPNESEARVETASWLDGIKSFFKFSPAFLTSAAAILILAAGIIWIAVNVSKTNYVAQNNQSQVQNNSAMQSPFEAKNVNQSIGSNVPPQNLNGAKPYDLVPQIKNENLKDNSTATRASARKPVLSKSYKVTMPAEAAVNKHKARNGNDVPSLSVGDEEEDSLRLSDLFEEVGMIKSNEVNNE